MFCESIAPFVRPMNSATESLKALSASLMPELFLLQLTDARARPAIAKATKVFFINVFYLLVVLLSYFYEFYVKPQGAASGYHSGKAFFAVGEGGGDVQR